MRRNVPFIWVGAFWLLAACSGPRTMKPDAAPETVVLLLTSQLQGQLEPCGCSENMQGGMSKLATLLQQARKGPYPSLYIDAGNALFDVQPPTEVEVAQRMRKAETMAALLSKFDPAAVAKGPLDEGLPSEKTQSLPYLVPNAFKRIDVRGRVLALVYGTTPTELGRLATKARDEGAVFVIAVVPETFQTLQSEVFQSLPHVDLLLAAHHHEPLAAETNLFSPSRVPAVQIQSRGRSVLKLTLQFGGSGAQRFTLHPQTLSDPQLKALDERVELLKRQMAAPKASSELKAAQQKKLEELIERRAALTMKVRDPISATHSMKIDFLPVEAVIPVEPASESLIRQYQEAIQSENLARVQNTEVDCTFSEHENAYVGNEACQGCHASAMEFWKRTKHAEAYRTLEKINRRYDFDCVSCHVTGYGKPGGVCRIDRVEGREAVGCESCHGMGKHHTLKPSRENIERGQSTCQSCHNRENSPHFDLSLYLPEILGEGHGRRLAP